MSRLLPEQPSCVVCDERPARGLLCTVCSRSYDRHVARDDGTIDSVLRWAAEGARAYEHRRGIRRRRASGSGR